LLAVAGLLAGAPIQRLADLIFAAVALASDGL